MSYHVYVSNSGSDFFSHFIMDGNTGELEAQADIDLGGQPGAVATNSAQTWMVVALRSQKVLASYSIDQRSGALTRTGESHLEEGPPYLYIDKTDRFLLGSYYGGGRVSVHGIGTDGTLSPAPLQELETAIRAHSIQTDRANRFAFVPHTNPTNAVYQFRFDAQSGTLTPNEPAIIQPETEEGPRHFIFHPHKDLLYTINENGSTVSAHRFDAEAGTLEAFQLISTLPGGKPVEGNTTAEIDITPDGKYLYGSNRGHDSLALFEINEDGSLSAKGHYPTEPIPRFFAIDPTGRYIYSAGQGSGKLAWFRIEADGALTRLGTYEIGQTPLWIQFVKQQ